MGIRRVLTHGTFDLLHYGHIEYLRKAKAQGDYLVVCLTTDELAKDVGKNTYYNYDIRKKILESIRYVDLVIPQQAIDKRDIIKQYQIDVYVSSSDYADGRFSYRDICEEIYFPRTPEISTTKIKEDIKMVDLKNI